MTALTDYINQQGAANVLATIRSQPYWDYLSLAVKSPKDLYHVVERFGWQTPADVQAWITACNSGPVPQRDTWMELVRSPCPVKPADMGTVTWTEMDVARDQQAVTGVGYRRNNSDANYLIPTEAQLRAIAKACPSWRYQGGGESMDCDDFTSVARGWLGMAGIGNLAAGKAGTVHYAGPTLLYGHAVVAAFTREAVGAPVIMWWWEPQTGQIHPVTYPKLGAGWFQNPDRAEIVWGDF